MDRCVTVMAVYIDDSNTSCKDICTVGWFSPYGCGYMSVSQSIIDSKNGLMSI